MEVKFHSAWSTLDKDTAILSFVERLSSHFL